MKIKSNARTAGSWMPSTPQATAAFLDRLRGKVEQKRLMLAPGEEKKYKPVVEKFKTLINTDAVIRMYLKQMIDQVPGYYREPDSPGFYLKSIEEMLDLLNVILHQAPEYNDTELVGFPVNTILDWTMGMPAGFALFRLDKLNEMLREYLGVWCDFLNNEKSLYVLNDSENGWKSEAAQNKLNMSQYEYDPDDPHWGFTSWNDFFTRRLAPGVYPLKDKDKESNIIVSACASQVYAIKDKVKSVDWFWVKSQPYSLNDMLAGDANDDYERHFAEYVQPFEGGTVYQAFLSALKYHRWHSPVSGTILKAYVKPGTYYSQAESEGMDPAGPNDSQGYITHVATRAIIFIQAEDPVGLMCVMQVGMAEVSSCVLDDKIKPGYKIRKGDEIGYFQYGGSTYCLVFRPGVIKEWDVAVGQDVDVRERIAVART